MLHNIDSCQYRCEYGNKREPGQQDYILIFHGDNVVLIDDGNKPSIPRLADLQGVVKAAQGLRYLFSIDETAFYLYDGEIVIKDGLRMDSVQALRQMSPGWLAFAGVTAYHLSFWYDHNRFCGKCGALFSHREHERVLVCPKCGGRKYPDISPVVIVGITDGDKILLTKYAAGNFRRYGLVAGFVEIGETLEEAVKREIFEEVGLRVKNIRYYDNQPWGFSRSLLVGFFAEVDGDTRITLDTNELSEAVWMERGLMPESESNISLTAKMMEAFRRGENI